MYLDNIAVSSPHQALVIILSQEVGYSAVIQADRSLCVCRWLLTTRCLRIGTVLPGRRCAAQFDDTNKLRKRPRGGSGAASSADPDQIRIRSSHVRDPVAAHHQRGYKISSCILIEKQHTCT